MIMAPGIYELAFLCDILFRRDKPCRTGLSEGINDYQESIMTMKKLRRASRVIDIVVFTATTLAIAGVFYY